MILQTWLQTDVRMSAAMTVSTCAKCDRKQKSEAGLCEARLATDGLPAMCVGPWAKAKHYYVGRYSSIFSLGMKNKWKDKLVYLDLFSGPGVCFNNEDGAEIEGSPLLAASQPFAHYIFADSNQASASALKERLARRGINHAEFIAGDVNESIDEITTMLAQKNGLCLAFADPWNIQLKMATIEKLANIQRVDLLIHFPYGTYFQRVPFSRLRPETSREIDEYFGDQSWRELYKSGDLNPKNFLDYYEDKLKRLGYKIDDNHPNMKNRRQSLLYYLILASKHGTGLKFWKKACAIESTGQRKLELF